MIFETERLIVRTLELGDELPFVNMASDGSLNDIGFESDCQAWMKDWITEAMMLTDADDPLTEYLAYAIVLKESNAVIGSVGCSYYEDLGKVGITYFIGSDYRGNGYAAEAASMYASYFFRHYDIPLLIATVRAENIASWKSVEKAGFTVTERKMYQDINDEKEELYYFYEMKRT